MFNLTFQEHLIQILIGLFSQCSVYLISPVLYFHNIISILCIFFRARIPHPSQKTHHQKSQSEDVESSFTERKGIAPAILTDKDLKGFDEILDSEGIDDWVAPPNDIDYNAKLVFSDDEDSTPSHQNKAPTTKGTSQNDDSVSKSRETGKLSKEQRDEFHSINREKEREKVRQIILAT